jgi:hypothetical protein
MYSIAGSIGVLLVFVFIGGGIYTYRRGDKRKGVLMVVFALVILGNLAASNATRH